MNGITGPHFGRAFEPRRPRVWQLLEDERVSMSEAPNTKRRFESLMDPQVLARISAAEESVQSDTAEQHDGMSADESDRVIETLRARRSPDDHEPSEEALERYYRRRIQEIRRGERPPGGASWTLDEVKRIAGEQPSPGDRRSG